MSSEEPLKKSRDPFADEPLPKAYYFPSMQKELDSDERKTCLSPTKSKNVSLMSPEDNKFLKRSNEVHEIPTHENGTTGDDSLSSKFDESWPSTEQTTPSSMTSPPTDPNSARDLFDTQRNQAPLWTPPPDSTLAKYVHRFRYSKPLSRTERDTAQTRSGQGGEFWWLSPPSSSSTPKEPEPVVNPSSGHSSSPSDRTPPLATFTTSPKRPNKNTSQRSPPPSRKTTVSSVTSSSTDILNDVKTKDLQERAKSLLEKSESALSWTSSSHRLQSPIEKISRGRGKEKPTTYHDRGTIRPGMILSDPPTHSVKPAPEDDILYQWRLARRMEKARESTKIGKSMRVSKFSSEYGMVNQGEQNRIISQNTPAQNGQSMEVPEQEILRSKIHQGTTEVPKFNICKQNQAMEKEKTNNKKEAPVSDTKGTQTFNTQLDTPSSTISSISESEFANQETASKTTNHHRPLNHNYVQKSAFPTFSTVNLPSHAHLSCDIVSCPHQNFHQNEKIPLCQPVHCCGQVSHVVTRGPSERLESSREGNTQVQHNVHIHSIKTKVQDKKTKNKIKQTTERKKSSVTNGQRNVKDQEMSLEEDKENQFTMKTPPQREKPAGSVSGTIKQAVSDHLFSTPISSSKSSEMEEESPVKILPINLEATLSDSSEDEFSDDPMLLDLRQKARQCKEKLRHMESLISQLTK